MDESRKDAIREACSTYGGDVKYVQNFDRKHWKDRPFWRCWNREEDIIKWILEGKGCEGPDWLHLIQGRLQWEVFVKKVRSVTMRHMTISRQ